MENVVEQKSFAFAVKVIGLTRRMGSDGVERVLANQLLRSGTSIGANETKYWIRLLKEAGNLAEEDAKVFLTLIDELMRILIAILKSSKEE